MIKLSNIAVMNFENAIRGMRNPLNSWSKSDSYTDENGVFVMGENDLALATKLANAGSDHRKFLRQILVSVDILAPLYWWKEFDTYKVGTVANSCSTMHKIHAKEFTLDDFSTERLEPYALDAIRCVIERLNWYRNSYNRAKSAPPSPYNECDMEACWYNMIQLLPTSYNQLRTVTLNYEALRNMHHARKAHKLDEWRELCKQIETLPYSELITGVRV